jgi:hypothetical protein
MPNPPPSAAAYPAMGVRVGYSDGNPLTTALLNQLAAYLVAQDGNGNIQQITCARIGPDAFVTADPSGSFWLTYNAYFDSGSMQWWPLNSGVACFAIEISASGISFAASPANTTPFAWKSIDSFNANGLASVLVIEGEIAVMAAQIAGLMASLANAGTPIFANTTAAQASILANGSYYYTISQSAGGALDLYLKNSGASSSLLATLPSLSSALNTPSSLQSASQTAMTLSLSEPFGTQYASTAYPTYTLNLPGSAPDGTLAGFVCNQAILALTVSDSDSTTIYGAPAATLANQPVRFEKKSSPAGWYPTSR